MGNTGSTQQQSPEIEDIKKGHDEDGGCEGCDQEEECKPEPYNPNLVGTVGFYSRAVIVCSGTLDWPAKLEKTKDVKDPPKVTACGEKSSGEGYDIYVYPDEVKYLGIKEEDIPVFIEDQIVKARGFEKRRIHVLVCTHGTRDKRCGRAGNQVLTQLQTILREREETETEKGGERGERVKVDGCSHLGGHKYAGVVAVYPQGDFYGYVGAKNVQALVCSYLDPKKPRANHLWRGRMGIDEDQQAIEAGFDAPKKKKDKGEKRRGEKGEKGEKGARENEGKEESGEKEKIKEETSQENTATSTQQ